MIYAHQPPDISIPAIIPDKYIKDVFIKFFILFFTMNNESSVAIPILKNAYLNPITIPIIKPDNRLSIKFFLNELVSEEISFKKTINENNERIVRSISI